MKLKPFVLYPWPGHIYENNINNKYNKYWTNFFKNKNVNVINLNNQFSKFVKNNNSEDIIFKYYIHGDVHFNRNGHQIIFENIDSTISQIRVFILGIYSIFLKLLLMKLEITLLEQNNWKSVPQS